MSEKREIVRWFETLGSGDVGVVGGKNASLGEMIRELEAEGIQVPEGFATTAGAYRDFVAANDLEGPIRERLDALQVGDASLEETGRAIREAIRRGEFPERIAEAILEAYDELGERYGTDEPDVAVRSSATAEDLPEASFAGQLESFLGIRRGELLDVCRECFASLFTDRAIAYREEHGFDHAEIALSVGVQKMVRSDRAGAGVMFTIDTETGFPDSIVINAAWGLGESVVKGVVDPDQYTVYEPFLAEEGIDPILRKQTGSKETKIVYAEGESDEATREVETSEEERTAWVLADERIVRLARWGKAIERHYGRPMDVEWAIDGESGDLFVVQARPETVQSRRATGVLRAYTLRESAEPILVGLAIGDAIACGPIAVLESPDEMDAFEEGSILVAEMTDPDWVPIMRRAAGIVTDHGGRTSHAAIVSRELGVPAVIGTVDATATLEDGREVTVSCAEGSEGYVYDGSLDFEDRELDLEDVPETRTRIMMNVASPEAAMRWWKLPVRGIGLARIEYVVNTVIRIHPMALLRIDEVEEEEERAEIERLTRGYDDRGEYFVERLAWGIATIAASQRPEPVIVRTSDFKTNEYADLIGGRAFEPAEQNPMLGWRGASRYTSERFRDGFALECRALRRVREWHGFDNVVVMIPFCRTPEEADRVLEVMADHDLIRGENGLEVYVMAEIPTNVLQADEFAERFDGFSIGTNDLTQLTIGVDRDASELAYLFDERNRSVKRMIEELIETAHRAARTVGICGQAPSDHPDFAEFLVEVGIDSISLNPDSVLEGIRHVAEAEARVGETKGEER